MFQVFYALPLKLFLLFPFAFNGKLARAFNIIAVIIRTVFASKVISNLTGQNICHLFADKITVFIIIILT